MTLAKVKHDVASEFTAFGATMIFLGIFTGYLEIFTSALQKPPRTEIDFWCVAICVVAVFIGFVSGIIGYVIHKS